MQKAECKTRTGTSSEPISVVIPAHDEANYIGACLEALLAQDAAAGPVEVIVAANGCSDATADIARSYAAAFTARSWQLQVLDLPQGGKPSALNAGDATASSAWRLYLDADIRCHPALLGQLRAALSVSEPLYATGRLELAQARSRITALYGSFWRRLPFLRGGAVGAGCYAVNAAGRERWDTFPPLIADDSYARLQFSPTERVEVPAPYYWPLAEGFLALVRVRRRQDAGMRQLFAYHPELVAHEGKARLGPGELLRLILAVPSGFLVYAAVALAVRTRPQGHDWSRGR
ncbi:glycosyltransferase [Pararhodobacter sp. SW119]|uniref:glycosyltransferase n=1 Tax=Pararhodobacter sp. SW119 TaxID=2780075 RepID=UPI001AE008B2